MKKKKIASVALAGVATATVLLAGTYAWNSISQQAKNEARNILNPGGRLHDDFTGMSVSSTDGKLKQVYVENFTEENGGDRIYARVRLSEYLEIGVGAGTTDENKQVTVVGGNTADNFEKTENWTVYKWGAESTESTSTPGFRDYVNINIGKDSNGTVKNTSDLATATSPIGSQDAVYYMPTYNKDYDNAEAEINGTLGGTDKDKTTVNDAYKDFIAYGDGTSGTVKSEAGLLIYTENEKGLDEVTTAELTTESITKSALKDGKFTGLTSTTDEEGKTTWKIALMKADLDSAKAVPYTVVDFAPAGATSADDFTAVYVDLDGNQEADIRLELPEKDHEARKTKETAKLISMEQWSKLSDSDKTGNYWVYDTDGWAYWAQAIEPQTATGCLISGISVNTSKNQNLSNKEYYYGLNVEAQCATAGDWGDSTTGKETGFYVGGISKEALKLLNTISGMEKMLAADEQKEAVNAAKTAIDGITAGSATTVTIDGVAWNVLVKDDTTGKALLWTADVLKEAATPSDEAATPTPIKKNFADAQTYLNADFLNVQTTLNAIVSSERSEKVFLLSEADVFGSETYETTADYTKTQKLTNEAVTAATAANESYWLRSKDTMTTDNAVIVDAGNSNAAASKPQTESYALRPAVWVQYKDAAATE